MPGHDTSSFVSRDRGLAGSSMEEFCAAERFRSTPAGLRTALLCGRAAAVHHANRSTVAKKVGRLAAAKQNDTNAETCCEPQTPCGTTVV